MTRTTYPEPGSCRIAITSSVVALINHRYGIERYLKALLDGELDSGGRTHKFNTDPDDKRQWREADHKHGDDMPALKGDVTWRKKDKRWQLDVTEAKIAEGIIWQEQVAGSTCDGCLVIPGLLPEALRISGPGAPVRQIVDSSIFDERSIIHTIIDWPGSPPSSFGTGRPDMTKIYIHCDRKEYHA